MARKPVGTIIWRTKHRSIDHVSEVRFEKRSVGAAIDFMRGAMDDGGWVLAPETGEWIKTPDEASTVTMSLEGFAPEDEAAIRAAAER